MTKEDQALLRDLFTDTQIKKIMAGKDLTKEVDNINHPKHYTELGASCANCNYEIECIDITRHMNFNRGNAIKYIWRADLKGNQIEDLKKAIWYLNDEIKRLEKEGNNA